MTLKPEGSPVKPEEWSFGVHKDVPIGSAFQVPGRYLQVPACLYPDTRISANAKLAYGLLLGVARVRHTMPHAAVTNGEIGQALGMSDRQAARLLVELERAALVSRPEDNAGACRCLRLAIDHEGKPIPDDTGSRAVHLDRNVEVGGRAPRQKCPGNLDRNVVDKAVHLDRNVQVHPITEFEAENSEQQPRAHSGGGPKAEEHPAVAAARAASGDKPGAAAVVKVVENMARTGDDPGALAALVEKAFRKDDPPAWLAGAIRDRRKDDGGTLRPIPLQVVPRDEPRNYPSPEDVEAARRRAANAKLPPGLARKLAAVGGPR